MKKQAAQDPAPATKYIFVTGGVASSLGKGIIAASLGMLLKSRGYRVTLQKFDPYLNIDPGTLNPYEHGECYVTDDGAETDLDLGHYERFLDTPTSQANNVTTGRIYDNVIRNERQGNYLGKTVQVIPHITDEIKANFFRQATQGAFDFVITEIGGCVGDIESLPFIEAVRQVRWELGEGNVCVVHLTLVPFLKSAGELKTKPTQHSVKGLLESGIQPDVLVLRTEHPLPLDIRKKVALFCNVPVSSVIESIDADTIYDVPLLMKREKLDRRVLEILNLDTGSEPDIEHWKEFLGRLKNPTEIVHVALVGKYVELKDSYKSIIEAFIHAGAACETQVVLDYIKAEDLLDPRQLEARLGKVHGILVAPGFGERGIEGKVNAVRYAREQRVPFLGICLGMQCAVVEFARNVLGLEGAASSEITPDTPHPVIDMMAEQRAITRKGGTMRLGGYPCQLTPGSAAARLYGKKEIRERHRHRYEFNNKYLETFEAAGFKASGRHPDPMLVELIELENHPFFMGSQFHPEYRSTVAQPHPLFTGFIKAALAFAKDQASTQARPSELTAILADQS